MNHTTSGIELGQYEVPTRLPVFHCHLGAVSEQLQLAREAIDELRVSHPESTPSNVQSVYMSPWKSHQLNPKFGPLTNTVRALAMRASKEFLVTDMAGLNLDLWSSSHAGIRSTCTGLGAPSTEVATRFIRLVS